MYNYVNFDKFRKNFQKTNCFSHTNTESQPNLPDVKVLLDSFAGKTIRIRVAKKPEMAKENLLSDGTETEAENEMSNSIWASLSR